MISKVYSFANKLPISSLQLKFLNWRYFKVRYFAQTRFNYLLRNWKEKKMCFFRLGSSFSVLNFGNYPIQHVTYLKLRRKYLLLSSWQYDYFHSKCLTIFSEINVILCTCSACNNILFFSAWDKSRVRWDNSLNSTQEARTLRNS